MSHASLFLIGKFSISRQPWTTDGVWVGCLLRLFPARKFWPGACDLTTSEFNYATQSEINIIDKPQGQRTRRRRCWAQKDGLIGERPGSGKWEEKIEQRRAETHRAIRPRGSRIPRFPDSTASCLTPQKFVRSKMDCGENRPGPRPSSFALRPNKRKRNAQIIVIIN